MTRKIIKIAVITIVLTMVALFLVKLHDKSTKYDHVKAMPSIELTEQNGTPSNLHSIDSTRATAIIFFNPQCETCVHEIETFISDKEKFENINMVFVTNADSTSLANFIDKLPIYDIPTAKLFRDSKHQFVVTFSPEATPMCYIYNQNRELVVTKVGQMNPKDILEFIEN